MRWKRPALFISNLMARRCRKKNRAMNTIRSRATEIINNELSYV